MAADSLPTVLCCEPKQGRRKGSNSVIGSDMQMSGMVFVPQQSSLAFMKYNLEPIE